MSKARIARHKTALHRSELSRPVRLALDDGVIAAGSSVFDYGCGRGGDMEQLRKRGHRIYGWDPVHRSRGKKSKADVVNIGYVVNVIEDPTERAETLLAAWGFARKACVVAARHTMESKGLQMEEHADGGVTQLNTFQKFYGQQELKGWIDEILGVDSIPAAPGVFYVFRDEALRESVMARRFRRRAATPRLRRSDVLFQEHRELLDPLMQFVSDRGRLPESVELDNLDQLCGVFGSIKKAFSIVRRVTGREAWEEIADARAEDLLVYLALARFQRRPKFSTMPRELQKDVRRLLSSYKRACELADILLFAAGDPAVIVDACRNSDVGKMTGSALYVHESALSELAPVLRAYEGCARAYVGKVGGANIIKLHWDRAAVSYLAYPDFDEDPHPVLRDSLFVDLRKPAIRFLSYEGRGNPPILHRKEEFVAGDHPRREELKTLTAKDEANGFLGDPQTIGSVNGWKKRTSRDRVGTEHESSVHASSVSAKAGKRW